MTKTTDDPFDRNFLAPGDKVWYENGFPDIRPGVIKARRVLHNGDNSGYVEYQLTFWGTRGWHRHGAWIAARWVVGYRS